VQINRNLIQQQHSPRPQQPHTQLHPPPLPITHSVQPPTQIHIQNPDQFVPAARVVVPAYTAQELRDRDVRAHDGVQHPFEAEVGYPGDLGGEGVDAAEGYGGGRGHAFAG
ncbi:hypothetical protein LTR94_033821, partial [Friedmanniomyces endolithicus]